MKRRKQRLKDRLSILKMAQAVSGEEAENTN
jgi:hypothetical protein